MIALIAHDALKNDMLEFVRGHVDFFSRHRLVATGNTGKMLHEHLGLAVERVAHGPHGGDLIIGGRVAEGKISAILFFSRSVDGSTTRTGRSGPHARVRCSQRAAGHEQGISHRGRHMVCVTGIDLRFFVSGTALAADVCV